MQGFLGFRADLDDGEASAQYAIREVRCSHRSVYVVSVHIMERGWFSRPVLLSGGSDDDEGRNQD